MNCLHCNTPCKNLYCSKRCSAIANKNLPDNKGKPTSKVQRARMRMKWLMNRVGNSADEARTRASQEYGIPIYYL